MKESDNLYAESMYYQIAASTGNKWASAKSALLPHLPGKSSAETGGNSMNQSARRQILICSLLNERPEYQKI